MLTRDPADPSPARRALITGGAGGIGWAICRALAAEGVRCVIADVDAARAEARAAELGAGHVAIAVDLSDMRAASGLVGRAAEALGGLEIVVNNAGITDTTGRRIGEIPAAEFARLVAVNLGSVEAICRSTLGLLAPGGVIVNIASGAALRAIPLRGAYSATKAAVMELTRTLDAEAAGRGIDVTAIAPGFVRTELVEGLIAAGRLDAEAAAARVPLGRLGTPDDIARAVAFAASPAGRVLAGRCLSVDGGALAAAGTALPATETKPPVGTTRLAVIGTSAEAERLVRLAGRDREVLHVARPAALSDAPPLGAVIDTRGCDATDTTRALANVRDLAEVLEARDDGAGLAVLLLSGGGDPATAAALGMMARLLALEWGPCRHRVNALDWSDARRDGMAELALWLTGDGAGYLTGQSVQAGPARTRVAAGAETRHETTD